MTELLRRSGQAPLHVRVLPTSDPVGEVRDGRERSLELVLCQLHRIRVLSCASLRSLPPQCVKMLAGTAPQLRRLALGGRLVKAPPSPRDEPDDDHIFCPAMLFQGNTPRLEYLELNVLCHGLRFRGPFSGSLRHLKIRVNGKQVKRPWPGLDDLLDLLSMLPSLEILDMRQDDRPEYPSDESRRIHLPHLHTIRLLWGAYHIAELLEHIDSPPPKLLDVAADSMYCCDDMLGKALRHTVGDVCSVQTLKISGFQFLVREQLRIQGDAVGNRPDGTQEHLQFTITLLDGQCVGEYIIWLLCQHVLDLQALSAFTLEMEDALYEDYLAILETMYEVKTFTLSGLQVMRALPRMIAPKSSRFHQRHHGYIPLIDYNPDDDSDEDPEDYVDHWPSPFLLPALETIVVRGAILMNDWCFKYDHLENYVDELCSVLRERASGGAAVKELCFKECSSASKTVMSPLQDVMEETGGRLTVI